MPPSLLTELVFLLIQFQHPNTRARADKNPAPFTGQAIGKKHFSVLIIYLHFIFHYSFSYLLFLKFFIFRGPQFP